MKKILLHAVIIFAVTGLLASCGNSDSKKIALIEDIPTVQEFKSDAIPDADIQKILNAGINAQSAMNGQPWHFSVVTNKEVLDGISEKMKANMPKRPMPGADDKKAPPADMPKPPADGDMKAPPADMPIGPGPTNKTAKAGMGDSPVAIIVSGNKNSDFDAGLAAELMTVEAVLLGYGTKIISSPTIVLNGADREEYQKILGIPKDMNVKGVVLIGKYDQSKPDAITSATPRKVTEEVVTFVK